MHPDNNTPVINPPLRWGFLGAARIAASYAKPLRNSSHGRMHAVASRNLEKAAAFAQQHDIPHAYGSYEDLLNDPDIEAIYCALPNSLHEEWSIKALEAGKHVLCEKPLACDAAAVRRMRRSAEKTHRILAEGLMYRFHPVNRTTIRLLREGAIGEIISAHASFHAPVSPADTMRFDPALGGGALLDLGVYCVSFLRWALGEEPDAVKGLQQLAPQGADVCTSGLLHFPSGALATFSCAYDSPFVCGYEIIGKKGRILSDGGPLCAWPDGIFSVKLFPQEGEPHIFTQPATDHYDLMAEAFAASARGLRPLEFDLEDSESNFHVLDRVKQSAA